jgi:prophage DNA circulation protein
VQLVASIQGVVAAVFGAISQIDNALAEVIALGGRLTAPIDGRLFDDFRATQTLEAFRALTGATGLPAVAQTGSRQDALQAANQAQIELAFQVTAAAEGVRALAGLTFGSRTTVLLCRDAGLQALTSLEGQVSDELWGALVDLRDAFNRRMLEVGAALPNLVDYTPQLTQPALCLAYDLHGDATREAELVARNDIKDPNFTPGSVPLKVLADG